MAKTVIADSVFLVALLRRNDQHRAWAIAQTPQYPHPWITCDAVLSEAFHLLGEPGRLQLTELLRREVVMTGFSLDENLLPVLGLMDKYADVPMSLADACIVRMTEILPDPMVLTTDRDFRLYRRHSRHVIPCRMP